ncbi:MAG: hypothetical protein ACRENE_25240, partial [Polyangiaceae bacterium]
TFLASVSFTDDTTALSYTIPPAPNDPNCPQGIAESFFPGVVEGNHAHYVVSVQNWVDGATNCAAALASKNVDVYQAVRFDSPSPTGLSGCWGTLATGQTDLVGSSFGTSDANIVAAKDGTIQGTLSIPTTLPSVSNYLRYLVQVWEGDTREPASTNGVGWSLPPSSSYDNLDSPGESTDDFFRFACVANEGSLSAANLGATLGWWEVGVQRDISSGAFAYAQALNAFQAVVQPVALGQLKVIPYTLLYAAPGDTSKVSYTWSTSYGISLAFDNKLDNNVSQTVDNKDSVVSSIGLKANKVLPTFGTVGIGATLGSSQSWDTSTVGGTGSISDTASSQSSIFQSAETIGPYTDPGVTPGANQTRAQEPFWADKLILLVHPQVGFWEVSPFVSLLAAQGSTANPSILQPTVKDLDLCASQTSPFASGYPINDTNDVLSSSECAELLKLDPFYTSGEGQSFPDVANSSRFLHIQDVQYGVDPATHLPGAPVTLTQTMANTNTSTVQAVGSYTGTITDVLTTSNTLGVDFSLFGVTSSDTFSGTETQTSSTKWTVTLQSSYTATAQSSVSVSGTLDDNHTTLSYAPFAKIYRDTLFGTYMFVDPTAP